jgi:uncharacterized protein YecE (DUF72 family)
MAVRVGIAGWSIAAAHAGRFPEGSSHLERYARRFNAAEINSSFHRPHRRSTYERWAATVDDDFRFAVKLPRTITHDRRLVDCEDLLRGFVDEVAGLGEKRGPSLVQLPPSFAFDPSIAGDFFALLARELPGQAVCEPRHASWFSDEADALLRTNQVARVAADPARVPAAAAPGGWSGLAYFRFHGSPRVYWSSYEDEAIAAQAAAAREHADSWVIYDNTTSGAAIANALSLSDRLSG